MFEQFERQSSAYCLPITDSKHFLLIQDSYELDREVEALGAFNLEANGHYGSAYFYSLSAEDDTLAMHEKIMLTIRKYIEKG